MNNTFGGLVKSLRLAKRTTLRDFCQTHGFDAGNMSRIERGLVPPPQKEEVLARYAVALGLTRGSDQWTEFFDTAAVSRGEIPHDLLTDDAVAGKLPVLFRTLRGSPMSPDTLDDFIDRIRRS